MSYPHFALGWHARVASALTGRELHYFTPCPLSELLGHLSNIPFEPVPAPPMAGLALAACVFSSSLRPHYATDPASRERAASAFAALLLRGQRVGSVTELGALAFGPACSQLRTQIVYAGRVGSPEATLFAVEDEVPVLMQDLFSTLANPTTGIHSFDLAALAQYVCLGTHPFLNGNGRTARLLAMYVARMQSNITEGALAAGLQWRNREAFRQLALRARDTGLGSFIQSFREGRNQVLTRMSASGSLAALDRIEELCQSAAAKDSAFPALVIRALLHGCLEIDALADTLRASRKKAAGLADAIAASHPSVAHTKSGLDLTPFLESISNDFQGAFAPVLQEK